MTRRLTNRRGAVALALVGTLALAACGGSSHKARTSGSQGASAAASFPRPKGKTVAELTSGLGQGPIVAPTVQQLEPGGNRYGFALFTRTQKQVTGVPVAIYLERQGTSTVTGPYRARQESLAVDPRFESDTVRNDPAAAKSFYRARLRFPRPGVFAVIALAQIDGRLVASHPIGARVLAHDPVPNVGDRAPRIHTPTVKSAHGNIASIDTRKPHDDMHDVDYADAYGKRPIVLLFATPALCQSRTCGPVTDVAEATKAAYGKHAVFIHNEIYRDNTIKPGCLEGTRPATQCFRPQLLAFHLQTEPFVFVIDRRGKVAARLEGAFSRGELATAVSSALR